MSLFTHLPTNLKQKMLNQVNSKTQCNHESIWSLTEACIYLFQGKIKTWKMATQIRDETDILSPGILQNPPSLMNATNWKESLENH